MLFLSQQLIPSLCLVRCQSFVTMVTSEYNCACVVTALFSDFCRYKHQNCMRLRCPVFSSFREHLAKPYKQNLEFISKVNSVQTSWIATYYADFENKTLGDMQKKRGGSKSKIYR